MHQHRKLTAWELVAQAEDTGRRYSNPAAVPTRYLPADLRDDDYIAAAYYDDETGRGGHGSAAVLAVLSVLVWAAILGYIAWRVVGA